MCTKKYNWLACVFSSIALLVLPYAADAGRDRFEGRRVEHSHHNEYRHVERQEGVVHHGHANVQVHNGEHGRYYNHGRHYNYYHNGSYYNYRHNGNYYVYYHNGGYYNYFYNGAYYNYYYRGKYYRTCVKVAGNPAAMVCH